MQIYPAIDLRGGRVIRLTKGDFEQGKTYGDDPYGTAMSFREAGAKHLHLIDLDGAKDGTPGNADIIRRVAAIPGLFLQIGGGIRSEETIKTYLGLGAGRVILGTVAVEEPEFLSRITDTYGKKIAVSVDARDGNVATRGWLKDSGLNALDFCKKLEHIGISTIIYTDINLDGMMAGTGLQAYEKLSKTVSCDIIASGGVSSKADITALRAMGLHGAIVGRAIYEGALELREIL